MTLRSLCSPWRAGCAAVLALAGLVYTPALTGTFIWDDHAIMDGSAIGDGDSLLHCFTRPFLECYYRPLVSVSFYLEKPLSKATPLFYHQTNILLHMLTTAVLLGLLMEAFGSRRAALFGAALFAVQPVQVSAVAWIGGRTDSLCALWMALFGWMIVRAARRDGPSSKVHLAFATLAFAAAVFTKEQMLAAIVLVPLAYRCFGTGGRHRWRRAGMLATIPFAAVGLCFLVLWKLCAPPPGGVTDGGLYILDSFARTAAYYALLLFAPTTRWMHTMSLGAFVRAGAWAVAGGGLVLAAAWWLGRRWLQSEKSAAAAWFLGFSAASLVMVSNIYPVPSMLVTPYRAGVAGIGVAALMGWALDRWMAARDERRSLPMRSLVAHPAVLVFAAALAWHGTMSAWGAAQWRNEETISATFVAADPDSIWARYNLSSALLNSHRRAQAIAELEQLLESLYGSAAWRSSEAALRTVRTDKAMLARLHEIQGTRSSSEEILARVYARLGEARLDSGEPSVAQGLFETANSLDSLNADANCGLGEIAFKRREFGTAVERLRQSLRADPSKDRARRCLGESYAALGRWEAARDTFVGWVRHQPWLAQPYLSLASAQSRLGDWSGAEATLEQARRRSVQRPEIPRMIADVRSRRVPSFEIP